MEPLAPEDIPDPPKGGRPPLIVELTDLLNSYSREGESGTPDFILANFLMRSLEAFEAGVNRREAWYGRGPGADNAEGTITDAPA